MEIRRRQLMEAWRAGSDDLALPELAPLAAELEREPGLRAQCDAFLAEQHSMRSALHEVEVPSGLADRLKMHLLAAPDVESAPFLADVDVAGPAAPSAEAAPAPATAAAGEMEKSPPRHSHGIRFLLGFVTLSCAVILMIAGLSEWWFRAAPMRGDDLVAAAMNPLAVELLTEGDWRGDLENAPPDCIFPAVAFHREVVPHAWREAEGILPETTGVAYRLGGIHRSQAYLLVLDVPAGVTGLDVVPGLHALHSTGGWVAGAWREGDRVCILLVEGDASRFRSMLRMDGMAV